MECIFWFNTSYFSFSHVDTCNYSLFLLISMNIAQFIRDFYMIFLTRSHFNSSKEHTPKENQIRISLFISNNEIILLHVSRLNHEQVKAATYFIIIVPGYRQTFLLAVK